MANQPATYRDIEEELVRRIEALDAAAHSQAPSVSETWHESAIPLSVIQEPSSLGHLAFNVWIQNSTDTGLERQAEISGYVYVVARLIVAFSFRLRAGNQVADARAATDAALDVTRAVMRSWPAGLGGATITYVDGLQPAVSLDGEWLLITQNYEARFDLALTP